MLDKLDCIFVIILLLFILAVSVAYYWDSINKILFNPSSKEYWKPTEDYKDGYVTGVNYWYFRRNKSKPVILFCHGNNDNITYRKYVVEISKAFDCNLLLFDYRGYGKSSPGTNPSIKMSIRDGEVMYNLLLKSYDPDSIIIWGESLGGSVAAYLASKYTCNRLILFSTFSSLDDLAYDYISYPPMAFLLSNLLYYSVNTLPIKEWVKKVECPTLIVHSPDDTLIPILQANTVFDNLKSKDKSYLLISGDHASPKLTEHNCRRMFSFCFPNSSVEDLNKEHMMECIKVIEEMEGWILNDIPAYTSPPSDFP